MLAAVSGGVQPEADKTFGKFKLIKQQPITQIGRVAGEPLGQLILTEKHDAAG